MDKLSEVFETEQAVQYATRPLMPKDITEKAQSFKQRATENLAEDYDDARRSIKELIESSMDMVPDLVNLVREAQNARMYEAASTFIGMVSDLNHKLLDMSKDLEKNEKKGSGGLVQPDASKEDTGKIGFRGTTEELMEMLSKRNLIEPPKVHAQPQE